MTPKMQLLRCIRACVLGRKRSYSEYLKEKCMSKAERYAELDSRDEFSEIHTVTPKRRSMILDALEKHAQKFPDIYLVPPPAPAPW